MGFEETARGFWGVAGICGVGGRGVGTRVLGAVTGASWVEFQRGEVSFVSQLQPDPVSRRKIYERLVERERGR